MDGNLSLPILVVMLHLARTSSDRQVRNFAIFAALIVVLTSAVNLIAIIAEILK